MTDPSDPDAKSLRPARERPRVAKSIADARPGDVIYTSRGGQVLPPGRVRWLKVRSSVVMGASLVAIGAIYGALFSPVVGAIGVVLLGGLLTWRLRPSLVLRDAAALSSAGRWEEAHALLIKLASGRIPPALRPTLGILLAATSSLLGRPEESLRHLDEIETRVAARLAARTMAVRIQVASLRANALARLERATEARSERARLRELMAQVRAQHPDQRADAFELFSQGTELTVAARLRAPEDLPDGDTLHQWAREALGRNRFGEILVGLAWAFDQRGDQEMARHLLTEAPSRVVRWSMTNDGNNLWTWAEQKCREWGLPPLLADTAD